MIYFLTKIYESNAVIAQEQIAAGSQQNEVHGYTRHRGGKNTKGVLWGDNNHNKFNDRINIFSAGYAKHARKGAVPQETLH